MAAKLLENLRFVMPMVCLAVWMALAGRSVVDKVIAVVVPVSVFLIFPNVHFA